MNYKKNRVISTILAFMFVMSLFDINVVQAEELTKKVRNLIINQVYGGGKKDDNGTSVTHTFIEIYNPIDEDITLDGYSLQYGTKGADWQKSDLTGVIKSKHSFLVRGEGIQKMIKQVEL